MVSDKYGHASQTTKLLTYLVLHAVVLICIASVCLSIPSLSEQYKSSVGVSEAIKYSVLASGGAYKQTGINHQSLKRLP